MNIAANCECTTEVQKFPGHSISLEYAYTECKTPVVPATKGTVRDLIVLGALAWRFEGAMAGRRSSRSKLSSHESTRLAYSVNGTIRLCYSELAFLVLGILSAYTATQKLQVNA